MKKHVTLTKEHARLHIRTYHLQHEDWRNKLLSFSGLQLLAQPVPQQPGITVEEESRRRTHLVLREMHRLAENVVI